MDLPAEYNNRALVPDHPQYIAAWRTDAEAFRQEAGGDLDLAYGARPRNRVDFFASPSGRGGPLVVFIHGGYWRSFDKSIFSHMARGANALGLDAAVPSYTLCPEATIPDIIDEMRQCCLFLSARYGRRLLVAGHSAGGHLAACMAATDWELYGGRPDLVQACLSVSGLFDLRPLMATPLNDDLRLTPADAAAASPLLWPVPGRAPLDSWVGGEESFEFLRQARSLPAAWAGLGVSCRYVILPGEHHFSVANGLSDPAQPLSRRLAELASG